MKASADLGSQTPQPARKGRGPRVKARASYVDESLFGSHAGQQTRAAESAPLWGDEKGSTQKPLLWSPGNNTAKTSPAAATPRKRNKYRLKSHTPSYCDESLFGPKPGGQEWAARCEVAKLRPLLWTPPSAPSSGHPVVLPSRPKESPLMAVHRDTPNSQGQGGLGAWGGGGDSFRKQTKAFSVGANQDASRRPRSQSLTRPESASDPLESSDGKPGTRRPKGQLIPSSPRGSASGPRARTLSGSLSARAAGAAAGSGKPRPPWK